MLPVGMRALGAGKRQEGAGRKPLRKLVPIGTHPLQAVERARTMAEGTFEGKNPQVLARFLEERVRRERGRGLRIELALAHLIERRRLRKGPEDARRRDPGAERLEPACRNLDQRPALTDEPDTGRDSGIGKRRRQRLGRDRSVSRALRPPGVRSRSFRPVPPPRTRMPAARPTGKG